VTEEPVIVHVLFMDIVDSTRETADQQKRVNDQLQAIVSGTREFQDAKARNELITLPTGDGMALVFLGKFEAPVRCAIEIARALKANPICRLRTGIHSGPVFVGPDINGMPNVSGEGIGVASRVMSCGGDRHILISARLAESLRHLSAWKDKLKYLGEFRIKKDRVHIWNFMDGEVGSAAPLKNASWQTTVRRRFIMAAAAGVAAVAGGAVAIKGIGPPVPPVAERSFTYSLLVKNAQGQTAEMPPDGFAAKEAQILLKFSSAQDGFLYVIAESPEAGNARSWSWLFPEPAYHDGSAQVTKSKEFTIPTTGEFLQVVGGPNSDTIHMLWTAAPVEEMETIKRSLFIRKGGELSDAEVAAFSQVRKLAPKAVDERRQMQTFVRGSGSMAVASFTLGHL
jgi:class 3 adenylate cyclase